ncbi:MAG: biopolymer transporter ExbD [Planctomycetota bacterium]
MGRRHQREPAQVRANLTPMIDVVFLLIIFFLLVAQISRTRRVELDLPEIREAQAGEASRDQQVIINVVPLSQSLGAGDSYRVGLRSFGRDGASLERLTTELRRSLERQPETSLLLRADRTESYERVHPAIKAARAAGFEQVELVTRPEEAS